MTGDSPRTPFLLKGALVAYEQPTLGGIPTIIIFQYNPEELQRTLTHRYHYSWGDDSSDSDLKVTGPPMEEISLTVEIDAADQLSASDPVAMRYGIHPVLSALELLLYPVPDQEQKSKSLAKSGQARITPMKIPLVLFVWGAARVLPVKLSSFSVRETAFDPQLNPIAAEVSLSMSVMTESQLKSSPLGHQAYMATQIQKRVTAGLNAVQSARRLIGHPEL